MEDQPRPDSIASVILINYPPKRSELIASICLEMKRQQDKATKDGGGFGFDAAIQCLRKLFLKPSHVITSRMSPALLTSPAPEAAGRAALPSRPAKGTGAAQTSTRDFCVRLWESLAVFTSLNMTFSANKSALVRRIFSLALIQVN